MPLITRVPLKRFILSPRRPGGEGRVRGAVGPVPGAADLTLPLRGSLPLPPEGRRGAIFLGFGKTAGG
jgi:hypothetical protein